MRHVPASRVFLPVLLVLLGAAFAGDAPPRLTAPAFLATSPGGASSVALSAGTAVTVLERKGGWARVRIEGWIPASSLPGEEPPVAAAVPEAPPPARVETAVPGAMSSVGAAEGVIRLDTKWLRKRKGAGASVWLLPSATPLDPHGSEEDDRRLATIDGEIVRLEAEAAKALESSSTLSAGTRKHDELLAKRDRKAAERRDLVASLHGRHEAIARASAVATTVADAQGWYRISGAGMGSYTLYARFVRGDVDAEWVVGVTLGSSTSRADLDETNARHLLGRAP